MKVLYIGHYRDGTGWGNAAVNNILAMNDAGVTVVPRPITYEAEDRVDDSVGHQTIRTLEMHSDQDCDVVVQHTLPVNYVYDSSYKNIGFLAVESSNFKQTGWQRRCNLMDEMWVPSNAAKYSLIESGVNVPIKVVPHSLNLSKYENPPEQPPIDTLQNKFVFGFVGEFIERKNIKALVRAFHMEFSPKEPVRLLIKTSKASLEEVQKYMAHIRKGLRIREKYTEEVIAAGMADEADYLALLKQMDCFVMPSRGEAFCIPSLETMAMGIPCIFTEGIGLDHVSDLGRTVKSYPVPCFGAVDTVGGLDTSNADWLEIDVRDLAKNMREAYNFLSVEQNREKTKLKLKERAAKYSHAEVGKWIKGILNDC